MASVRVNSGQPFPVGICQFGYMKARYGGLGNNTAHVVPLFPPSNL